jgi:hypothetical protein
MVNVTASYMLANMQKLQGVRPLRCSVEDWQDVITTVFIRLLEKNPQTDNTHNFIRVCLSNEYKRTFATVAGRTRFKYINIEIFNDVDFGGSRKATLKHSYELETAADFKPLYSAIEKLPAVQKKTIKTFLKLGRTAKNTFTIQSNMKWARRNLKKLLVAENINSSFDII